MKIRKMTEKDLLEAENLVCKTFKKCNFNEGTKEAVQDYLDWHNPKKNFEIILKVFKKQEIALVASENDEIVGIIRGKRDKIGNLFVDPEMHRRRIAKKLVENFESKARKLGSHKIKIKASQYAIPFYQKMGYKKTTGIINFKGLKFQPMRKIL